MLEEFKDFLMKGNIVDLAVAFVLGLAFAAVVSTFVTALIMPLIAMIFGQPNFNDLTFTINDAVFSYGAVITQVINFVAVAAAVFFIVVKPMQAAAARRKQSEGEGETGLATALQERVEADSEAVWQAAETVECEQHPGHECVA